MLPDIAASMSASVGFAFFASNADADINCPDWQYPHWGTCSAIQASWSAWLDVGERPSTVVTLFAPTLDTGVTHERTGSPSRWTVQAPHCDSPHPNFVPVSPMLSRITQSSGMSALTSRSCCLPFTVSEIIWISFGYPNVLQRGGFANRFATAKGLSARSRYQSHHHGVVMSFAHPVA